MSYYGYKRGDNDKVVNFAGVLGELSGKLKAIEDERAAEREKIEGEVAEAHARVDDVPTGNDETANNVALGMADQSANMLRIHSTLLKNGSIKPTEFANYRQNILDGAASLKRVMTGYNASVENYTNRQNTMEAGEVEAYFSSMLQNASNFQDNVFFVNEKTGRYMMAPRGENGKPDMTQATSIRDMESNANQQYDRFDIPTRLKPSIDSIGEKIKVIRKAGVLTRESFFNPSKEDKAGQEAKKALDAMVKSFTVDPSAAASILTDFDGGYSMFETEDKERRIGYKKEGNLGNRMQPDLTPDQQAKAEEILKEQALQMLGFKEVAMPVHAPQRASAAEIKADLNKKSSAKTNVANGNLLHKLWAGGAAERQEVLEQMRGSLKDKYKDMVSAKISGDQIIIHRKDKGGQKYEEVIEMGDDVQSFIESGAAALLGVENPLQAVIDAGAVDMTAPLGSGDASIEVKEVAEPPESFISLTIPSQDEKGKPIEVSATGALSGTDTSSLMPNSRKVFDKLKQADLLTKDPVITQVSKNSVGAHTGDLSRVYGGIEVFVPDVMDNPIIVPVDSNFEGLYSDVISKIYNTALEGGKVSDDDIKSIWQEGNLDSVEHSWESYNVISDWAKENRGAVAPVEDIDDLPDFP